jgi:uncharacterized oxidoreductase
MISAYVRHLQAGLVVLNTRAKVVKDYVKGSPPADPEAPVLVPGEQERLAREERARTGIVVDPTTWEEILAAGEKVGVTREQMEGLVA